MTSKKQKPRIEKRVVKRRINCDLSDPELNRKPKDGCGFIYMYTFRNGKRYVGQTIKTVVQRVKGHTDKRMLVDKIIKSGASFKINILDEVSKDILDKVEEYYIKNYGTLYPYGYNQTSGGIQFKYVSEYVKKEKSDSKKRLYKDLSFKNKMRKVLWDPNCKKVLRLEDGKIYKSIREAAKDNNVPEGCVSNSIYGITLRTNGYHFAFYSKLNVSNRLELLECMIQWEMDRKEIGDKRRTRSIMQYHDSVKDYPYSDDSVICLETGIVYRSATHAANAIGVGTNKNIMYVIKGKANTIGGYHWIKYSESNLENRKEILDCFIEWEKTKRDLKHKKTVKKMTDSNPWNKKTSIRCIETGETFTSIYSAAKSIGVSDCYLCRVINGEGKSVKGYHFEKVV